MPDDELQPQDSLPSKSSNDHEEDALEQMPESTFADRNQPADVPDTSGCTPLDVTMSDAEMSCKIESVKQQLVKRSKDYGIPQLERLYTRIMKGVFETKTAVTNEDLKTSILSFLLKFAEDESVLV